MRGQGGRLSGRRAALLVALCVAGGPAAHATSLDRPWTSLAHSPAFEHVSVEQGLSQSSVHTIAQDKLGFLWMGTDAGLNRYDGFRFQTFHPDGSRRSLAGDWIERIVPDRHGYLWIAARNEGLTLLDPESLAMVPIPISAQPGGLPARTVTAILEDRDGTMWIGTETDGLFRVDAHWAPPAEPRFERIVFADDGKVAPKRITSLLLDHAGALWLATPERGLGRLASDRQASTLTFDYHPFDPNHPTASCPAIVNAIAEDPFGKLWLGGDDGLVIFDPASSQFTRWTSPQFKAGIGRVLDVLRDTKDTLWVAGDGMGLFKAPPRQRADDPIQLDHFAHDPKDAGSLSRNGLQCVFEDASGLLWVSAYQGGLNKVVLNPASHDRARPSVFQYRGNAADPDSLSGDTISAIGEDRFGNLWVGTDGFGLNRLVAPTSPGQPARFEHFRNDPAHAPGSLRTDVILTAHLDPQKQLWLGSYLGGLIRVDQASATARPTFTHFTHDAQDRDSLHSDFVRDIVDDGAGGFWIAFDAGAGLDHFDPRSGKAKHYEVGEGPRALKNGNLMRVVKDRFGTLWIATQLGLHRFNPMTEEFRVYGPGQPDALSDIFINTLYLAPSDVLWVGTKSGRLNRTQIPPWDGPPPRFSVYGKAAGLSDAAIMSILPDSKGDLWLATRRALFHFDTTRTKAGPFTYQRELRRAEFIWNAAYVGVHGEMFFGSNDGLTIFHPDDIVPNAIPPVLAFTDFRVRNQALPLRARMNAAARPTDGIPEIVLHSGESMFSLEFAALHFAAPDQNQYAYRLDGLDPGWNEIGNRHSVTYSALPAGDYLLSVRASNCDGVSSRDDLKLRIRMLPPWHGTWWFRAALAAGVLLLFYVLVRVRLRVLRHRNATLEHKVEERTRELGQRNQALRIVLDNVDQGLFRVDLEGRMLEERSTIVDRWFGPCQGRPDLVAYVGADARFAEVFTLGMEAVREGVMPLSLCLDQLPKRLVAVGRHFDCHYLPIEEAGTLRALLCVLDDVTEGLKRVEDEAEQRELVAAFMAFTRDRAGFVVFVRETERILRELGRADLDPSKRKRLLHTLKGNAGVPGLGRIAEICHLAETELEIDAAVSAGTMARLQDHWAKVAEALRAVTGGDGRAVIELSDGDLDDLALRVQRGASAREVLFELARLRWEPVQRPLARLAEHGRALGRRLKGAEIDVQIHADDLRLDPERWNPLWSALVHLVRNAVDHGLESAEERASTGKPARGLMRLEARSSEAGLRLVLEDDGRGIDWEAVRRLCLKRSLPGETRADLFAALLRPDFSSRGHVTETSGRGVGLAAVAASVAERGGTLAVESEPGRGTRWILNLPLDHAPSTVPDSPSARSTAARSAPETVGS